MSNTSEERSPRFSRAILGRMVAVLAFVCLGTFAVIQSVVGDRNVAHDAGPQKPEAAEAQPLQQGKSTINPLENKLTVKSPLQATPNPTSKKQVSFGKTQPPLQSKTGTKTKPFSPPKSTSFGDNAFAKPKTAGNQRKTQPPVNNTPTPNSSSAFAFAKKPTSTRLQPPAAKRPSLNASAGAPPPIVVAKQATPTVTPRSKSQPSQRPARQSSGARSVNQFGGTSLNPSGFNNAVNNAAEKTGDIARDLKNAATQKSSQSLQGLRSNFNSAVDSAKSSLSGMTQPNRSSFGDRPSTQSLSDKNKPPPVRQSPSAQPPVSFNASQGLRPFGQSKKPQISSSNRFQSNPSGATNNSAIRATQSNQRFNSAPSAPPSRQPMRSVSGPSRVASSSSLLANTDARTQEVPGDRKLEGVRAPSLTIEKIAPREIQVNQPADFQIVIRNAGRVTATNVQVFDRIPVGTEFVAAVPQPNRSGANEIRWDLGEMRPGQEKRVKLQLKPTRPGEIGSVAHVTFATQASMRTLVTKPMLQIQHSAQPKILIGDNAVFDITVENKGDGPANNVVIQQDIPDQLEFSDGSPGIEYPIGTLGPGQSRKLKLALRAAKIGRLKNVLVATADGDLKAQHAIDLEVIAPQLIASAQGPTRKFLKREATHQFSVENKGTADATNVELIARLPSGLKFVGANNRGKYDPNSHAVYWSLAELTPAVVGSVEIKTVPIESGEQKINFEAVADLNQKAQTSHSLVVEHLIDVFFDIDDVVDPIEIGSPTKYVIRVINQGTKTATNVRLQVDFPNGIQPVSVDGTLPSEIRGQQVLFAPITSMNPGDELKLTVNGKGVGPGDHRVAVHLQTDGRETNVTKEETTRVYNDR